MTEWSVPRNHPQRPSTTSFEVSAGKEVSRLSHSAQHPTTFFHFPSLALGLHNGTVSNSGLTLVIMFVRP